LQSTQRLTGLIEREGNGFVALCPELDVASQGDTVDEARRNLIEAVELFFETASPNEIQDRLHGEVYVTPIEVKVG
jgi:predicted RNase H-like HicB family nuclease